MRKHIMYFSILIALLLLMTGCGESFASGGVFDGSKALVSEAKAGIKEITYDELKKKLEAGTLRVLIDLREASEFETGYINQPDEDDEYPYPETFTVNIPRGLLEFKMGSEDYWNDELWVDMPAKDEEIVVYCKSGGRSALAAHTLLQMGYTNVSSFNGGYRIWLDPTLPLEEDTGKDSGG
ncbi:rhodanese-like domain-containing protein [Candidatus Cloacimonadota bacterium]